MDVCRVRCMWGWMFERGMNMADDLTSLTVRTFPTPVSDIFFYPMPHISMLVYSAWVEWLYITKNDM